MKIIGMTIFFLLFHSIHISSDAVDLVVTYQGEAIANVSRAEVSVPFFDEPVIDEEKLKQLMEEIDKKVYQEAVDATINENGAIVPEKAGYQMDRKKFREMLYSYFFTNDSAKVEVPMMKIFPNVDSELLANIRTQQIGQYVTYFNHKNEERSHNIFLASEAINNHVVFPGKTFSFNKVVGKRTEEKGYLPAPEIVEGELTEGIGGGICQVSSTLYNAVDRAGVQMIERYSHSKKVPYVPPGRDATVSWYGPDFTFKNNLNQPLLIRSKTIDGKVMINIFSSEQIEYTPREVPDAS
ncbi:VanW family protein [Gracilibacillus xinjiangensis]|uniref:VanW family protein n=1 Tax=Gracilibacillus xinjiangensis TaxID=1193282 RepID=A0ABV8WXN0_9BACI